MMGLGMAMREELIYEDGNLINGSLFDYRVPRTTDLPPLRTVLVERGDGVGPYGAKGGGEGALNPWRRPSPTPPTAPPASDCVKRRSPRNASGVPSQERDAGRAS